jgi:hypothetical protein
MSVQTWTYKYDHGGRFPLVSHCHLKIWFLNSWGDSQIQRMSHIALICLAQNIFKTIILRLFIPTVPIWWQPIGLKHAELILHTWVEFVCLFVCLGCWFFFFKLNALWFLFNTITHTVTKLPKLKPWKQHSMNWLQPRHYINFVSGPIFVHDSEIGPLWISFKYQVWNTRQNSSQKILRPNTQGSTAWF